MSRGGERCILQRDAINALGRKCGNLAADDSSSNFQCLSAPSLPTGIRDPISCGASVNALNNALKLFTFGASGDAPFSCSLEGWLKVDTDCGHAVGQLNAALTSFLDDRDFADCTVTTPTSTPTTTTTRAATTESSGVLFAGAGCALLEDPALSGPFNVAVANAIESACAGSFESCVVNLASVETVCVAHDDQAVAAFFTAQVKGGASSSALRATTFQSVVDAAVAQGQVVVPLGVSTAFPWLPDRNLVAVSSYPRAATFQVELTIPSDADAFDTSTIGADVLAVLPGNLDVAVSATPAVFDANGTATYLSTYSSLDVATAEDLSQFEESVGIFVQAAADGTFTIDLDGSGPVQFQVQLGSSGFADTAENTPDGNENETPNLDWIDGLADDATSKAVSNPALIGGLAGAGGLVLILAIVIAIVITRSHHRHTGASNMYLADQFSSAQTRSSTPFGGPGGLNAISETGYMDVRGRPTLPIVQHPSIFGMDPSMGGGGGGGGHYYPSESTSDWSVWNGEQAAPAPFAAAARAIGSISMAGDDSNHGIWSNNATENMPSDLELAAIALAQTVGGFENNPT